MGFKRQARQHSAQAITKRANGFYAPLLAAAFYIGLTSSAFAEACVVVASSSDAYTVGANLEDEAVFEIEDGATISVLTNTGRIVKLFGLFEGTLPDAAAAVETVLGKLAKVLLETDDGFAAAVVPAGSVAGNAPSGMPAPPPPEHTTPRQRQHTEEQKA